MPLQGHEYDPMAYASQSVAEEARMKKPVYVSNADTCVDELIARVGKTIVMAAPLALAKPNHLINALYRRTKTDAELHFTLITAVSLEKPSWSSELEKRFLEPIVERIWGDFPDFDYVLDMRRGQAPSNFELVEFFTKAGGWISSAHVGQRYLGSNYTHAVRDAVINGCNVISQLVTKKTVEGRTLFSMSSNPDTHLEGLRQFAQERKMGRNVISIAQVNTNLPFMYGRAVVPPETYDLVIDNPDYNFRLFGAPKESVSSVDWMIGLHASTLVRDGGTLQVGIGSLGDAVVAGLSMRHKHNSSYCSFLEQTGIYARYRDLIQGVGGTGVFEQGLLASSEMLVDSLLELFKSDIIKRRVYEDLRLQKTLDENGFTEGQVENIFRALVASGKLHSRLKASEFAFLQHYGIFREELVYDNGHALDGNQTWSLDMGDTKSLEAVIRSCLGDRLKNGVAMYASFFIGPQKFYSDLREMDEDRLRLIDMRGVDYVNQLYGNEELKRAQRRYGRFINGGLMVHLTGAVTADCLEDHRLISGPGGQYNFVSMAHALEDGRAITMIRSTRGTGKNTVSNVVWQYGHTTIPRHLRDIVVTEYGMADLRGRQDWEVMTRLICIADSRFQKNLLETARKAGKIPASWEIPEQFKNNTPEMIEAKLAPFRDRGLFQAFPFGTDLTPEEIVLGKALRTLKESVQENRFSIMHGLISRSIASIPDAAKPFLSRMALDNPSTLQERLMQKMVLHALNASGQL